MIAPGEAAVTGFAGAPPPPQIAPGDDPAALTFIDASGPSLRIVDLRHMGGRAAAQLVGAPKPFTVPASEIGQGFGVALDDASPPNIYVAASSSYGLPIVAPGPNGRVLHVRTGAPKAAFMPGLWGPRGGPGSIWKIDGASARVSLFADVKTGNRPNSGAALGGLAFDPQSKSLFVADRETGLVHRLGLNGADLGSYDHGVAGRAAQELAAVPWAAQQPIDVTSPRFDSGDPATWNLASPERRVFGLSVHEGRLFYAVADSLQVWSVGLRPDGAFGDDAVIELAVPPAAGPTEISKIAFDAQGRMLLAERPAPTGAFDLEALSRSAIGRVLRYAIVGKAAGRRVWQEQPDEYALGFPHDYRNGNGGVDVGYNYDRNGDIIAGSCGGFVWMSGEDLRESADATLAARLAQSGPSPVSGLQGVGAWQDRPRNAPPVESYFVSYADGPPDDAARGHMGDIAILRVCEAASHAGLEAAGRASRRRTAASARSGRAPDPDWAAAHSAESPPSAAASAGLVPAGRSAPHPGRELRAKLPAARRPDRRPLLSGRNARGQRRMFELGLPGRADGDRTEQFLLRFEPRLHRLGRRAGLLRRPGRQRPMRAAEAARLPARRTRDRAMPVPQRLHPSRWLVLPFEQRHLDRGLLPAGAGAGIAEQERVRADPAHSDRPSLLCRGPHPDRERRVLRARERDDDRGLLLAAGRSVQSRRVPGANPEPSGLRCRLRQDAGRELLQPALRQRRRTLMPRRPASLRSRRVPQCAGSVRASRPAAGRRSPAGRRAAPLSGRRSADAQGTLRAGRGAALPARPEAHAKRRLRAAHPAALPTRTNESARTAPARRSSARPVRPA